MMDAGGGATPAQIQLILQDRAKKENFQLTNTQQLPALTKIRSLLQRTRNKLKLGQGVTDCEVLWTILRTPDAAPFIVWPKNEGDFPVATRDWYIVFASSDSMSDIDLHGREVVGLDGNFKLNKYRYPTLVVSLLDDINSTAPGAIFILSAYKAELVQQALEKLIPLIPGRRWDPTCIMIDKDIVELVALQSLKDKGIISSFIITCEWHNLRTWYRELVARIRGDDWKTKCIRTMALIRQVQRSTTEEELKQNIKSCLEELTTELELPNVAEYLETNWFSDPWLPTWIDLNRPNRRGLFNTDNASEVTFKVFTQVFFRVKVLVSLSTLCRKIIYTILPYYALQRTHKVCG